MGASRRRAHRALAGRLHHERRRLVELASRPVLADRGAFVRAQREVLDSLHVRARRRVEAQLHRSRDHVGHLRAQARALSPQSTLDRGYAVVARGGGEVVTDPAALEPRSRCGSGSRAASSAPGSRPTRPQSNCLADSWPVRAGSSRLHGVPAIARGRRHVARPDTRYRRRRVDVSAGSRGRDHQFTVPTTLGAWPTPPPLHPAHRRRHADAPVSPRSATSRPATSSSTSSPGSRTARPASRRACGSGSGPRLLAAHCSRWLDRAEERIAADEP